MNEVEAARQASLDRLLERAAEVAHGAVDPTPRMLELLIRTLIVLWRDR